MTQQQSEKCPVCDKDYQGEPDKFCQFCAWPITPTVKSDKNKQSGMGIWKILTKPYMVTTSTKEEIESLIEPLKNWQDAVTHWAKSKWRELEGRNSADNKEEENKAKNLKKYLLDFLSYLKDDNINSIGNQENPEELKGLFLEINSKIQIRLNSLESNNQQAISEKIDAEIKHQTKADAEQLNKERENLSLESIENLVDKKINDLVSDLLEKKIIEILEQKIIEITEQNRGLYSQAPIAISETEIQSNREYNQKNLNLQTTSSSANDNQSDSLDIPEEFLWIQKYNEDPNTLSNYATEVSETEDSVKCRRLGTSHLPVLAKERKGNYWILTNPELGKSGLYLVPKNKAKFNEYSKKTLEAMFECRGCTPESASDFKVIKPALVETLGQDQWQLRENGQGILFFEE